MNICECGCGQECNNKFVFGHTWINRKHTFITKQKMKKLKSEEHKQKLRGFKSEEHKQKMKGPKSEEHKQKLRIANLGKKQLKETIQKRLQTIKQRYGKLVRSDEAKKKNLETSMVYIKNVFNQQLIWVKKIKEENIQKKQKKK